MTIEQKNVIMDVIFVKSSKLTSRDSRRNKFMEVSLMMRKEGKFKNKKVQFWTIVFVFGLTLTTVGFIVGFNMTNKPLGEEEFIHCEQAAEEIYAQLGDGMIGIPYGYSTEISNEYIIVRKDGFSGSVKATWTDHILTFEHNSGNAERVSNGCYGAIVMIIIVYISILLNPKAYKVLSS